MSMQNVTFPAHTYAERLKRAQHLLRESGMDAAVIGTGADFAYLTGAWVDSGERLTALILRQDGAEIVAPATDIADLDASPVPELPIEVQGWSDGEDSHGLAAEAIRRGSGAQLAKVGFSDALDAAHVLPLQATLKGSEFELASRALAPLLYRKDEAELKELRRAGAAIDKVHAAVPDLLQEGSTEAEVAKELERLILEEHVNVDFVIVGSAENGANPHHSFSDRVLRTGDPVVVDLGGTLDTGYHSDCTRTYVVGGDLSTAPQDFQEAYAVLEAAQAAGRAAAHVGSTAAEVDAATRKPIEEAGWGEYFVHRTGHGIGLSTHEEPFIMAGNDLNIDEDMAFSIEPGIYLPGKWGMRLEDIVVAGDTECESLNQRPRGVL